MKSLKLVCASVMFLISMMGMVQQAFALNINTASVEELQEMKGVGETRAKAIVSYRDQHGPFAQVEDLLEVEGIGEATLARNRDILTVN